ncbi:hypothetical protein F5Y04DRAFT_249403 [Hypomontagnella monticulosa]|nr:hypothetical protein F5Y04DRAFT_249403 [Hypomontagnella monticulosa]
MAGQTIKYSVEHYRKPGVSDEAFMKWFQAQHLPNALPLMKKHGITKYAVHHRDAELCAALQAEFAKSRPGWVTSRADLVLEYWLPSMSCLQALVTDPEWTEKAIKGQDDWVDMSKSIIHLGPDTTYLENGSINI